MAGTDEFMRLVQETLAQGVAQQSAVNDPYGQALATYGDLPSTAPLPVPGGISGLGGQVGGHTTIAPRPGEFVIGPQTGAIRYTNGVIADPAAGQVIFPTAAYGDPENVKGSEAWLAKIQDKWDDKTATEWRKKLVSMGYDQMVTGGIAPKGGMAHDLLQGLRVYYQTKYLNFGKEIRATPKEAGALNIRKAVDPAVLDAKIDTWFEAAFQDSGSDAEKAFWREKVIETAADLARDKGYTPEAALHGAEVRVQQKFAEDPEVAGALEQMEEEEFATGFRDKLVSATQLAGL